MSATCRRQDQEAGRRAVPPPSGVQSAAKDIAERPELSRTVGDLSATCRRLVGECRDKSATCRRLVGDFLTSRKSSASATTFSCSHQKFVAVGTNRRESCGGRRHVCERHELARIGRRLRMTCIFVDIRGPKFGSVMGALRRDSAKYAFVIIAEQIYMKFCVVRCMKYLTK